MHKSLFFSGPISEKRGSWAKSKIRSRFLLFYAQAPEGLTKVDDITLAGGVLTIEDRTAGKRITLPVSLPL